MNFFSWSDASYYLPEVIVLLSGFGAISVDLALKGKANHGFVLAKVIGGLLLAGGLAIFRPPVDAHLIFGQMMVVDGFSHFFRLLFIAITLIAVLFSYSSREIMGRDRENKGEYYALLMFLCFGMMAMASAVNLIMLAMSIELVSITSYILAGYARYSLRSSEAAMKYVLWGAVSSGVMLFGMSILFGLTGEIGYGEIGAALASAPGNELAVLVAVLFIMAGIGYKISAVPFHFWTPDVYEGSIFLVGAFFAVVSKLGVYSVLVKLLYKGFAVYWFNYWHLVLLFSGILSLVVGCFGALGQRKIKRLLGYSTINNVGFILLGLSTGTYEGMVASFFYLLVYITLTLVFFSTLVGLRRYSDYGLIETIEELSGLFRNRSVFAILFALGLFSFAGVPPFIGFFGKFYLFASALKTGNLYLVIIAVLMSALSLYYYLKIIVSMYMSEGDCELNPLKSKKFNFIIIALSLAVLLLGIFSSYLLPITRYAASYL